MQSAQCVNACTTNMLCVRMLHFARQYKDTRQRRLMILMNISQLWICFGYQVAGSCWHHVVSKRRRTGRSHIITQNSPPFTLNSWPSTTTIMINVTEFHFTDHLLRTHSHALLMWTMQLCSLLNVHHWVTIAYQIMNTNSVFFLFLSFCLSLFVSLSVSFYFLFLGGQL